MSLQERFIEQVLVIMNEAEAFDKGEYLIGSNTEQVEKHIKSSFVTSWRKAVVLFPKTYFDIRDFSNQPHKSDEDLGIGSVVLPDDFYSLSSFKMKGWQKAVETLYDNTDAIASLQANEYTRGSVVRPVCIRDKKGIRERVGDDIVVIPRDVLLYYSIPPGKPHVIEEALYIPLIPELNDNTNINEKLFLPLAYLCAGEVFLVFEKGDISQALTNKAIEIIK